MKKYILVGGVLLFVFALSASFSFAAGKAAPKATGEIWFDHPATYYGFAYSRFDAHDGTAIGKTDKGEFYYSDWTGYYLLELNSVTVTGNTAYFSGSVIASNHSCCSLENTVYISVLDGGTPGSNGDLLNGNVNNSVGVPFIPVTAGNLVVHD